MVELELPSKWVSIDPGDIHFAVAEWRGKTCLNVTEFLPDDAIDFLENGIRTLDIHAMIYEKFALDLRRASQQNGSEMLTSQGIGVIRYLGRRYKVPAVGYFNHQHKKIYHMDWYLRMVRADHQRMPYWTPGPRGGSLNKHKMDAWSVGMWFKHQRGYRDYVSVTA